MDRRSQASYQIEEAGSNKQQTEVVDCLRTGVDGGGGGGGGGSVGQGGAPANENVTA